MSGVCVDRSGPRPEMADHLVREQRPPSRYKRRERAPPFHGQAADPPDEKPRHDDGDEHRHRPRGQVAHQRVPRGMMSRGSVDDLLKPIIHERPRAIEIGGAPRRRLSLLLTRDLHEKFEPVVPVCPAAGRSSAAGER